MTEIKFTYENPLKARFGDAFFKSIPNDPGVYVFVDARGQPLYIGKADNLHRRLMSYQAAKPGRAPEHILEMIELADGLKIERHGSGARALARELDLIRVIRPPYNIAGTEAFPYLFIGVKRSQAVTSSTVDDVEFRLSVREVGDGFTSYGCFRQRGKAKSGYGALLRLFHVVVTDKERFQLPARICRSSPPYRYKAGVPLAWRKPFDDFLRGESDELLRLVTKRLLEKDNVPALLYAPLQRDLVVAREFYAGAARETRLITKEAGLKRHWISQKRLDEVLGMRLRSEIETKLEARQ